jgi:hypothetical protein
MEDTSSRPGRTRYDDDDDDDDDDIASGKSGRAETKKDISMRNISRLYRWQNKW